MGTQIHFFMVPDIIISSFNRHLNADQDMWTVFCGKDLQQTTVNQTDVAVYKCKTCIEQIISSIISPNKIILQYTQ